MTDKERQLYCGNLSEKVTEDILYELFLQAGPLESVTIPKDKDGRPRRFAFITFKHAVSVPYTLALMNGISLFGKPLHLDARTGAESEHNPYLEKLVQYTRTVMSQPHFAPPGANRNYNQREAYNESQRYDSRRFDSRPETRTDYNAWNAYPSAPSLYGPAPPGYAAPHVATQARFVQSPNAQLSPSFPYNSRVPWSRNQR